MYAPAGDAQLISERALTDNPVQGTECTLLAWLLGFLFFCSLSAGRGGLLFLHIPFLIFRIRVYPHNHHWRDGGAAITCSLSSCCSKSS